MDPPVETVNGIWHVQSTATEPKHAANSENLIESAEAKLQELQRFGFKFLLVGMSPEKFVEKTTFQGILRWMFLVVFYGAYVTYQISVAIFVARNLLEVITNLYIASYLGSFFFQWSYLYYITPKLYTDRIRLVDFQCTKSCAASAERTVVGYLKSFRTLMVFCGFWLLANVILHLCGPIVEAVMIAVRGGQVENTFILPQMFKFPIWGQILMYFWNAVTTSFLLFYCLGSYTVLGIQTAKIKILCEILNEALEIAPDNRLTGKYVEDHVEIIKRAKELMQQLANINLFVMTTTYVDFATQMFIVTLFDANLSYYIALAYDMSSIFLLMAMHCFIGTELTRSLESIADGSYNSKWYEDKDRSKHVVLMTQMSQKKLEQKILLGSLKVERATALNLLRSSYAAYTVLKFFQE